jgi:site-specific recombinase XerD
MYTDVTSVGAHVVTTASSFAELRSFIADDALLPAARKRDMISALGSLAKALGRPADAIQADTAQLRKAMAHLTPAMVGLKPGRWRNVQSLVGTALAHVGIVTIPGRLREEPSSKWLSVLDLLGTGVGQGFHLWRFARYCTRIGVEPIGVDDALIARFGLELLQGSLVSEPERAARDTARAWNKAVLAHSEWPQRTLTIPDNRRVFAPDWEAYPPSLLQGIEAWIARLSDRGLFSDHPGKPLAEASQASRRRLLRVYLGALFQKGVPLENLVDLAAAVTPANARIALEYFWDKAGQKPTCHAYQIIQLVLMIARHEAKLPADQIAKLELMVPHLKPAGGRMTERNAGLLHQLDDPEKRQDFYCLPSTLLAQAKRLGTPSIRTAHEVQTASMIEILIHVPMRLKNLRGLRLGSNVLREARGIIRIKVPGCEVKNGTPIDARLPPEASKLVAVYIDTYRPLLAHGSDFLLPGAKPGVPKSDHGTREQIKRALADHVGIVFHPHLFRHLAAKIILQANPTAHPLVQRILGHTSLNATMTFYSGLETDAAHKHLDGLIAEQRQQPRLARTRGTSR